MTIFKDFVQLICVTSVFSIYAFHREKNGDWFYLSSMKTVCSGWNSDQFCASFNGKIQFNLEINIWESQIETREKDHRRLIKMNAQPFIWHSLIPKWMSIIVKSKCHFNWFLSNDKWFNIFRSRNTRRICQILIKAGYQAFLQRQYCVISFVQIRASRKTWLSTEKTNWKHFCAQQNQWTLRVPGSKIFSSRPKSVWFSNLWRLISVSHLRRIDVFHIFIYP